MQHRPLLILAVVWLAILLVPAILVLVQMMRTRLAPTRVQAGDPGPALSPDQQDAVAELVALGFILITEESLEIGACRYGYRLFRHAQLAAFAGLSLQPQIGCGYPVTFYSLAPGDELLVTVNRRRWMILATPPRVRLADPCTDKLDAHWQAHRDRLVAAAAIDCSDELMHGRVVEYLEGYLPLLRSQRLCADRDGVCTPTVTAAISATRAWQKLRRKLGRRYRSAVTEGAHQAAYFARCYEETEAARVERVSRRDVKVAVLVASILVSFLFWSLAFSPESAVALVAVLLVREGGHAVAMRSFGHRDMSMFFLPFFGAVVTGDARSLPAWKQAVILFAGPIPGLLAGAAMLFYWRDHPVPPGFNWKLAATMALYVNLFNLLPIVPLDGGRLIELSLFSRWPRLRIVFSALSSLGMIGIAAWAKNPVWIGLATGMAFALRTQWRVTVLLRNWQAGLNPAAQIQHLFETIRQRWPGQLFARQFAMVRNVVLQRSSRTARLWESLLIIVVIGAVWSSVGLAGYASSLMHPGTSLRRHSHPAVSTPTVSARHSGDDAVVATLKQAVTSAVAQGQYEPLETLVTTLRTQDLRSPSGIPQLFLFYFSAVKAPVEGIPIERKEIWDRAFAFADHWMSADPQSSTAILMKSELLIAYGWAARGSGYADTVSDEAAKTFNDSMHQAYDLLQNTKDISSRDPDWFRQMAAIYKNASLDRSDFMVLIDEALARYPAYYPIYTGGAQYELPKWGGSDKEVRAYIRHVDEHAPPQLADLLYGRIYAAIGCCGYTGPDLFTVGGANWQRLRTSLEAIRKQYPDPLNIDTEARNACRAGDAETLRVMLSEIGDAPIPEAWSDDINYFHACRDFGLNIKPPAQDTAM